MFVDDLCDFGGLGILDQIAHGDSELVRSFEHRTSLWGLVHSTCVIFARNLEPRKSAIAMSIFVERADRGDFRDLGRELCSIHYILRL